MKNRKILRVFAITFGLLITIIFILILAPKIIEKIMEKGFQPLAEIIQSYADWSNPAPFFFTYLVGYAVTWWKQLWGSIIIIAASIFYMIIEGLSGPPIFAIPALIVGLLYLAHWLLARKK